MSNSTSPVRLAWITVSGTIGSPIEFGEREIGEDVVEDTVGYSVRIRKGRRWQTGYVSRVRLDVPSVSLAGGTSIEGGIWCFASNRDAAETKLVEVVRRILENVKKRADVSLSSLA